MPKFLDDIIRYGYFHYPEVYKALSEAEIAGTVRRINSGMEHAQIFDIQNVAEYIFQSRFQDEFSLTEDFPNLAPPFEIFWMEYQTPTQALTHDGVIPLEAKDRPRVGALFRGERLESAKPSAFSKELIERGAVFTLSVVVFVQLRKQECVQMPAEILLSLDEAGRVVTLPDGDHEIRFLLDDNAERLQSIASYMHTVLNPMLLAISFLHCKNVKTERVEPPAKLAKAFQKRTGRPLLRYHVLRIEPMKKILAQEGDAEKTGIKRALHICRGHFKDYRDSDGLFGKVKGLFWWDSHVRGNAAQGITLKDYQVDQPKGNAGGR